MYGDSLPGVGTGVRKCAVRYPLLTSHDGTLRVAYPKRISYKAVFGCCISWPWRSLPNSLAIQNSMYISYEWSDWASANISMEIYDGSSVLCPPGNPTVITVYSGEWHDTRIHFYVTFFCCCYQRHNQYNFLCALITLPCGTNPGTS
jgi:hypothetical protein